MKGSIPPRGEIPQARLQLDWASSLCDEIREQNKNQWFGLARVKCLRCQVLVRDNPGVKCFCRRADNRGCTQVNAYADRYYWAFHGEGSIHWRSF